MLVKMKVGRDLYYPGELVTLDDASAEAYIAAGVAEPVLCPECRAQMEDAGCAVYCRKCSYRRWKD